MLRKMMMALILLIMITVLSACGFNDSDTKADSIADAGITEKATAERQIEEENNTRKKQSEYTSWNDVPVNKYREETITVDYNGQTIGFSL